MLCTDPSFNNTLLFSLILLPMGAVAASPENRADSSPSVTPSHSKRNADASPDRSSSTAPPTNADAHSISGDEEHSSYAPSPSNIVEIQSPSASRSEEYRQLFRLPPDELLVQDFNCAFQESILLQGHMYLFNHYICFYSNIFGFETKKIIPFLEVIGVKRAKTAGIFPNAIEIFSVERKYFFASFLSRDEAFKIINDGWLQQGNCVRDVIEQQDSLSECGGQENSSLVIGKENTFKQPIDEWDTIERDKDALDLTDSKTLPNAEVGVLSPPHTELQTSMEQSVGLVVCSDPSSSTKASSWTIGNSDPPEIPASYTRVAETRFSIKVEEFFSLFFSNNALGFTESFHQQCKDQDLKITTWSPHEEFEYTREKSFRHPIKIYLGAKFGSCKEVQKFRVHRNSHLVIETSQTVNDVPYGDHFTVEGRWDIEKDVDGSEEEGCILRVYVDVKFTKKTIFRGKILQSTVEECREAYALWIKMAHEFLKERNLQKPEDMNLSVRHIQTEEVCFERESGSTEILQGMQSTSVVKQHDSSFRQRNQIETTSLWCEPVKSVCSYLKRQSPISLILVVAFAVIILMQVSILVLLNKPQDAHMASPVVYTAGVGGGSREMSGEAVAWLERRMNHLKDEMYMVESRLERMRQEHASLKAHMKDLQ